MRYVLELSYRGTPYHGWQIQQNAHTVQQELNNALETILKQSVETIGSGRTDTGVHALQQFAHFDYEGILNPAKLVFQLNAILPESIFVYQIYGSSNDFSARFDAVSRSYVYKISYRKDPFLKDLACFYYKKRPNIELMNQAASLLLKYTDFQSFSKYHTDVNHFECFISKAFWQEEGGLLLFHISANRFLRGMVRAIVGSLLEVGSGKISVMDFEKIILMRDRKYAKAAVPAQGLYLSNIVYPAGLLKPLC